MKKIAMFLAMATLLVFPLAGCGGKKTLKVGATPALTPIIFSMSRTW